MSGRGRIETFGNRGSRDIFLGNNTKKAREILPVRLHDKARQIMDDLNALGDRDHPMDLTHHEPESLTGYENWYSLRINRQFRVCFIWMDGQAYEVQAIDYH